MAAVLYGLLNSSAKTSVQEATAVALPANTYSGGVLTATANGALVVDGITVANGDRVLVKNEATAANNGIYNVSNAGSSISPYVLTRSPDMSLGAQVPGAVVFCEAGSGGSGNAGAGFVVASSGPFTLGTTAITWSTITTGGAFLNPMNTVGDIPYEGAGPAPARLPGNTSTTKKFLQQTGTGSASAAPAWGTIATGDVPQLPDYAPTGLTGALTPSRYVGATASGAPASGTFQALDWVVSLSPPSIWICTVAGSPGTWSQVAGGGLSNPMSSPGDTIYGATSGTPTRLPIGAVGQVYTVSPSSVPEWANNPAGFASPMNTQGDTIVGGSGGTPQRLGLGSAAQFLVAGSTLPSWVTLNPAALPIPNATYPGVRALPNGDLLWLPFTYFSGSGDDGAAFNAACALLPSRTEQYGTQTHSWQYGRIWSGAAQYIVNTMMNKPAMADLLGQGSGSELLGQTGGMTILYSHSTSTDGGATGSGVDARHVNGVIENVRIDGTAACVASAPSTTVAAGSTGVSPFTAWTNTSPGTFHVGSTTGWVSTGGMFAVATLTGTAICSYTSTSTGLLNGCVWIAGAFDTIATGGAVTASVVGLDVGDGHGHKLEDVQVVNCFGTGAIGWLYSNRVAWSEKCRARMDLLNCTNAAVLTNLAGSGNVSQEYNDLELYIQAQYGGQSGITLSGGAFLSGGTLRARGNFPVATPASGPFLTIAGSDGSGGNNSNIHSQIVDLNGEANGSGTAPQTILFGTGNNSLTDCTGILSFRDVGWVLSNVSAVGASFSYAGIIKSEANLKAANAYTTAQVTYP